MLGALISARGAALGLAASLLASPVLAQSRALEAPLVPHSALSITVLDAGSDQPHVANGWIGGALLLGGAVALVSPIVALATLGTCVDPGGGGLPAGYCRAVVVFGPINQALLGIGLGAIVAGALVLSFEPIRVRVSVDRSSAQLWLWARI